MWRIAVEVALPIVLPFVVYILWLGYERRRMERLGTGAPPRWQDAPFIWLGAAGLALAAILLVAGVLFGGEGTQGRYVPPQLIDGEIVPGRVEPAAPTPAPQRR